MFAWPLNPFSPDKGPELIVWSVGQGQMVTYSNISTCLHFDMGGEYFPKKKLVKECGQKKNWVFFSHWDWDHINFTRRAFKKLRHFCRLNEPGGDPTKDSSTNRGQLGPLSGHKNRGHKKKAFLLSVPLCSSTDRQKSLKLFRELLFQPDQNKSKRHTTDSNKASRVVVVQNRVLIPGDSPGSSERLWMHKIRAPIELLVLSHHGSRYATTWSLLSKLPHLKLAIASARKKRYNHPHPFLKARLTKKGVPVLSTEEFRHIRWPLSQYNKPQYNKPHTQ